MTPYRCNVFSAICSAVTVTEVSAGAVRSVPSVAPGSMTEALEMYRLMRACHGGARWGNVSETALNTRILELHAAGLLFDPAAISPAPGGR